MSAQERIANQKALSHPQTGDFDQSNAWKQDNSYQEQDTARAMLRIIENNNCPLYEAGDEFKLSERVLSLPQGKATCIVLVLDITEVHLNLGGQKRLFGNENDSHLFNCTGTESNCIGKIRLEYRKENFMNAADEGEIQTIARLLSDFSIFESLNESKIIELVSFLKHRKFEKGEIIINKGDPGLKLFIIIGGKVEVLGDDGVTITFLRTGDVFGEMSLLSGEPIGATIRVAETARVLYIDGKDFRRVLQKFPSLQMYFARLLARRLSITNALRAEDLSSGMIGKLSDISPTELFQTLNQNQKTGVLSLELIEGQAEVFFKEGEIVRAIYDEKKDTEAFFELLKPQKGRFKFTPGLRPADINLPEIGDFMWLLMEGLNKMDEQQ